MLLQMHRGCSYNKKIFILCNGIVLAIVMAVWVNVYLGLKNTYYENKNQEYQI